MSRQLTTSSTQGVGEWGPQGRVTPTLTNIASGQAWLDQWWRTGNDSVAADRPLDGPFVRTSSMARVEAILFLATEPVSAQKLAQFASLADRGDVRRLIGTLNEFYDGAESAFRVEEVGGGYQLFTKPSLAADLAKVKVPVSPGLTAPAMETLSVVAYQQPVTRASVEAIRGVSCGELLRHLMDRRLIRIAGRSKELGRPVLYGTTKTFLRWFGLGAIQELPRWQTLSKKT